ncbi:MAG: hypothetical protein ACYCZK_05585 [Microbacteriaceae bacterium]
MSSSKSLLLWGTVLLLVGALLEVFLPAIAGALVVARNASGQEFLVAVEAVVRVLAAIVPPLGAALVAAGIVLHRINIH